jgi:hypothetical protein
MIGTENTLSISKGVWKLGTCLGLDVADVKIVFR